MLLNFLCEVSHPLFLVPGHNDRVEEELGRLLDLGGEEGRLEEGWKKLVVGWRKDGRKFEEGWSRVAERLKEG